MSRHHALAALCLAAVCTAACSSKDAKHNVEIETATRDSFGRTFAIDAGAERALGVGSRGDVLFEEGFSLVTYDPAADYRNHAFRWMGQRGHVRLHEHGDRAMRLKLEGWVNEKVIRAKPVIAVYLDGRRIYDTGAVENGFWGAETVIPAASLRGEGWMDLVITASAVAFHWSDPPMLNVVVLNKLEWSEAAP